MMWSAASEPAGSGLHLADIVLAAAAATLPPVTGHEGHGGSFAGIGIAAAFVFGLLGSTHCLGMCGPLVGLYASQLAPGAPGTAHRQHLLFNLGRALTYVNLGIFFGAAGLVLRARPWVADLAGVAVGLFVLIIGSRFLGLGGAGRWAERVPAWLSGALGGVRQRYVAVARSPSIVFLGALHGLLPCPLLYVMFTSAVALGNPIQAGVLLLSFSLGTVPMMWGAGALGPCLRLRPQQRWHRIFGGAVTAWGLVLVARGLEGLGLF